MSNYTITTNFGAKDSLPSGNAAKIIKGSEFTTEFTNIKTAVNTKADTAGDTFTGAVTFDAAVTLNADVTFDTNTMFVDVSENRVGIGTTSPDTLLEVVGADPILTIRDSETSSGATNATLRLAESGGGDTLGNYWDIKHNPNAELSVLAGTSERMRIDSSGNVGIGTSSPDEKLVVKDGTYAANQSGGMALQMGDEGGSHWKARFKIKSDGSGVPRTVISGVANNSGGSIDAINISNTGNVGIGQTNPQSKLVVQDTNGCVSKIVATDGGNQPSATAQFKMQGYGGRGAGIFIEDSKLSTSNPNDRAWFMGTGYSTANFGIGYAADGVNSHYLAQNMLTVDTSGKVGIGTSSPSTNLHVAGGSSGTNQALFRTSSGGGGGLQIVCSDLSVSNPLWSINTFFGEALAFGDGTNEHMRIDTSGNVLVGRTSGSTADEDNGIVLSPTGFIYSAREGTGAGTHIAFINNTDATATTVGTIRSSGSTTSYNTSSDERLKENITDSADAGSKVDAIQIRQFDWKADGSHQDYGVIAQELLEVAPEAVSEGDTEEDMMGVDYSKLVPMLIKEVQSLRSRVAELESE